MIKDKILNLINLCLEVQRGKDGNIEARTSKESCNEFTNDKIGPTVFFEFSGHVCSLEIRIFKNGWGYFAEFDERFQFYLDKEIDKEEFERCKTMLEEIIRKQKEQEEK